MRQKVRVEVRSGVLEGRIEDGLAVFRGVPFARVTERWARPVAEPCWSGLLDASVPGPASPQRPGAMMRMLGMGDIASAEECLSLQVWTPGLDAERRPVLVWLHGGGFTTGAGSLPIYDGSVLARRGDAVVVTVNYRLGALGFLHGAALHPAFASNCGLHDQIAALEWVREHVERFGGDPECVTVFGESAGAMSIGALLASPRSRGLFRRAILQSGAAHNVSEPHVAEAISGAFHTVLEGAAPDALRALGLDRVLDAQQAVAEKRWRDIEGPAFQPARGDDLLPEDPLEALAAGASRDVEVLVGTNLDEWRLYGLADAKARNLDEAGLMRRLVRKPPGTGEDPAALARKAIATYRAARSERGAAEPRDLWFAFQTDRVFRIPAIRLAEAQGRAGGSVHMYRFRWSSPALDGALGSCHGLEVPFVFGTLERAAAFAGSGEEAQRLATRLQDHWLAFARGGDPGWTAYGESARATFEFGRECGLVSDPDREERHFWEGRL